MTLTNQRILWADSRCPIGAIVRDMRWSAALQYRQLNEATAWGVFSFHSLAGAVPA
ncbi:MAG: hypothetical protein U0894_01110 [Pirellulales bacterium]